MINSNTTLEESFDHIKVPLNKFFIKNVLNKSYILQSQKKKRRRITYIIFL